MDGVEHIDDVHLAMFRLYIDDLRSGDLPKGKFIGKYMQEIRGYKMERADVHYKRPQVIGEGDEADNNWLDYVLTMPEEEFQHFRQVILENEKEEA